MKSNTEIIQDISFIKERIRYLKREIALVPSESLKDSLEIYEEEIDMLESKYPF